MLSDSVLATGTANSELSCSTGRTWDYARDAIRLERLWPNTRTKFSHKVSRAGQRSTHTVPGTPPSRPALQLHRGSAHLDPQTHTTPTTPTVRSANVETQPSEERRPNRNEATRTHPRATDPTAALPSRDPQTLSPCPSHGHSFHGSFIHSWSVPRVTSRGVTSKLRGGSGASTA